VELFLKTHLKNQAKVVLKLEGKRADSWPMAYSHGNKYYCIDCKYEGNVLINYF